MTNDDTMSTYSNRSDIESNSSGSTFIKNINPISATFILWTTQSPEDVTTTQPLHKRIYKLIPLIRWNIMEIVSQSLGKGITPILMQGYLKALEAAYIAIQTGSTIAVFNAKMYFYQYISFTSICFVTLSLLNGYTKQSLNNIHTSNNIMTARRYIFEASPHSNNSEKSDKYKQARNKDNESRNLSDIGDRFSYLSRKSISFFIDIVLFSALIGPSMLIPALIVTTLVGGLSYFVNSKDSALKSELDTLSHNARTAELEADMPYSDYSVSNTNHLYGVSKKISLIRQINRTIKNIANDLSHPAAVLYFSYFVLHGNMNPIVAVAYAGTFRNVFKSLLEYPDIILGRGKFRSSIKVYLDEIQQMSVTFLSEQLAILDKPYFPKDSIVGCAIHTYIYITSITVIAGVSLFPLPAIQSSALSYLLSLTLSEVILALGLISIGWCLCSILLYGYEQFTQQEYPVENTTSFHLVMAIFTALTYGALVYGQSIFVLYSHISWSKPMYFALASSIATVALFDKYCFQSIAYAIDGICAYFSQEVIIAIKQPIVVSKTTYSFASDKFNIMLNLACNAPINGTKFALKQTKSVIETLEGYLTTGAMAKKV